MENIFFDIIPDSFTELLLVIIFSLLIGLSQRRLNLNKSNAVFGTDRTFTLIGLLGYILYLFNPDNMYLFAGGALVVTAFLTISYYFKVDRHEDYGITSLITALITYCMGPLVTLTPSWFYVSVVVIVLLLTEMKTTFVEFAQKIDNDEFITVAKFLLICFIVLPMLPNERIIPDINLTPYKIWLATVIVSAISYSSYILRKYVFPKSGVVVSGLIGGLYSSTATITILSRKCRNAHENELYQYISAMFLAVAMMFLRLLIIIAIFNLQVFNMLLLPMSLMFIVCLTVGGWILYKNKTVSSGKITDENEKESENPLEFKIALIFAFLFVVFTLLTYYSINYIGTKGLTILSFLSGLGDITPFILNLLEGQTGLVTMSLIAASCLQATLSNNIIKMFYAIGFSGKRKEIIKPLVSGFAVIGVANIIVLMFFIL